MSTSTICLITIFFTIVAAESRGIGIVTTSLIAKEKLRFKNGVFKIVQFTDLHLDDLDYLSEKTTSVQERILADENPDLVVMTVRKFDHIMLIRLGRHNFRLGLGRI